MTTSRRRQTPALVASLVVLVVLGAALAGPWHVTSHPFGGLFSGTLDLPTLPPQVAPSPEPTQTPAPSGHGDPFLSMYVVIGVIVTTVLVVLLVRFLNRIVRERRPQVVEDEADAGSETLPHREITTLPALADGVDAARRVLAESLPPGDAVIAAWVALERAAERTGVPREPAQTPTEFTVAVLGETRADPDATRALLDLYLRARFSEHPLVPGDVARASRYLEALSEGVAHRRQPGDPGAPA